MPRREFSKSIRREIVKRATKRVGNISRIYCECCHLPTDRWHIDHIIPDALRIDKSGKLTAEDGQLLCAGSRETCHGKKTAEVDVPAIRQAVRREDKRLGVKSNKAKFPQRQKPERVKRPPAAGMPGMYRRFAAGEM